MELFNTILCKILYPRNTNEELRDAYLPNPKPFISLFNANMDYRNAVIIHKNPIYKDFLFFLANNMLFYSPKQSDEATVEHTIYTAVSAKYSFLKKNINTFMTHINNDFIDLFKDVQKHYRAFARFANIWRHKRSPVQIDHDLYMTPLHRDNRSVFSLLQQGKIYLFTTSNLVNSICTSLSNAPNFFVEPLVMKNPYNNIPFNKSDLYNIYFFLKHSPIIMPMLFHNYFLVDFDLRKFRDENENVIKCMAFKSHIRNATANSLYNASIQMLKKYQKKIVIHKDFPKDTLVNILRPYLLLYYITQYSAEEYRVIDAEAQLHYKLKKLYQNNPAFGRKLVKLKRVGFSTRRVRYIEFSDKHPDFDEPVDIETYQKTHLEMIEAEYSSSDEDEDATPNNNEDDDDTQMPFIIISPQPSLNIGQSILAVLHNTSSNTNVFVDEDSDSDDEELDEQNTESVDTSSNEIVIESDSDDEDDDEDES